MLLLSLLLLLQQLFLLQQRWHGIGALAGGIVVQSEVAERLGIEAPRSLRSAATAAVSIADSSKAAVLRVLRRHLCIGACTCVTPPSSSAMARPSGQWFIAAERLS